MCVHTQCTWVFDQLLEVWGQGFALPGGAFSVAGAETCPGRQDGMLRVDLPLLTCGRVKVFPCGSVGLNASRPEKKEKGEVWSPIHPTIPCSGSGRIVPHCAGPLDVGIKLSPSSPQSSHWPCPLPAGFNGSPWPLPRHGVRNPTD